MGILSSRLHGTRTRRRGGPAPAGGAGGEKGAVASGAARRPKQTRVARRVLGSENRDTIELRVSYAISLYKDDVSRLNEALAILVEVYQTARRVFSDAHPITRAVQRVLSEARESQADDADDAAR